MPFSVGAFSFKANLISLLQSKFLVFDELQTQDRDEQFNFSQPEGSNTNFFGTQVITSLEIEPFKYNDLDGSQISILRGVKIDAVVMTITQSKNIVTTPIQGRNGTVKEYISDNDYQIEIEGVLATRDNSYPIDDVNNLIEILKAPVAIKMVSKYLAHFGITDVVVTGYEMPQSTGYENIQQFRISGLSDKPVELQNDTI